MTFIKWFAKLFEQVTPDAKPSDKWEGRIVRIDPPYVGDSTKTEYPFLAQIRQHRIPESKWTDYDYKETIEEAEDAIRHFKEKMDIKPTITFIKNVD